MKEAKVFTILLIAITAGLIQTFAQPYYDNAVPATWKNNWLTKAFFNGAFIVAAVSVAAIALKAAGVKGVKAGA